MALPWRRAEHWRREKLKENGWRMLVALELCVTLKAWLVVTERAEQESRWHKSQAW